MRLLLTIVLTSSVYLVADDADLIEFAQVADAQRFGWAALPGSVLATAKPGKIGRHALRIDASAKPQEYMGIGLTHDIDLTGAGTDDKLILFVKQNFGDGICVNVRTAKGHAHRYAKVTREQWHRVELDLNLANWQQNKKAPVDAWPKVGYLHIYSKAFDKAGEFMLMDGFAFFVGGKPVVTRPETRD